MLEPRPLTSEAPTRQPFPDSKDHDRVSATPCRGGLDGIAYHVYGLSGLDEPAEENTIVRPESHLVALRMPLDDGRDLGNIPSQSGYVRRVFETNDDAVSQS